MPDEPKNENTPDASSNNAPADQNSTPENTNTFGQSSAESAPVVESTDQSTETPVTDAATSDSSSSTAAGSSIFGSDTSSTPEAVQPTLTATTDTSKKKKKGLIIGLIIAIVAVLGGGGASAYFFWYQNPDKVVFDSLSNAISAKSTSFTGSMKFDKDGQTLYDITLKGKGGETLDSEFNLEAKFNNEGVNFDLKGDLITDKDGNLYVRVNEVQNLLNQILPAETADIYTAYFGDVIEMVDGKWVKVSSEDLESVSADYATQQQCLTDATKSLTNDKAVKNELTELFKKNKFVNVEKSLGSKSVNGVTSLGFQLKLDKDAFVGFVKGISETQFGKALKECDESYDFSSFDGSDLGSDSENTTTVELWASQFGHQLTEINITGSGPEGTGKIVVQPKFNEEVKVTVPTETTGINEIYEKIESTFEGLFVQQ